MSRPNGACAYLDSPDAGSAGLIQGEVYLKSTDRFRVLRTETPMIASRRVVWCLLGLAGLQWHCAVFRAGGQDDTPPDVQTHRFGRVVYEMVNWENENQENAAGAILLSTLRSSASFTALQPGVGARDWFVQIILETTPGKRELGATVLNHPTRFMLETVNGVAFGQSFFIFPKVNYIERTVKFVIWQGGRLRREYAYESNVWALIGWLGILFVVPSERNYLTYDMSRVARHFAADAAN